MMAVFARRFSSTGGGTMAKAEKVGKALVQKGRTWGERMQDAGRVVQQAKIEDHMQGFVDVARAHETFSVHGAYRETVQQALKMTTVQSAVQKAREYLPFFSKDAQREEMERRIKIIECMSDKQKLLPLSMSSSAKQELAIAAGASVTEVNKMLKEFVHARALHEWMRVRMESNKPLPVNNKELQQLVFVQPTSRTFMMQAEMMQSQQLGKRGRRRRRYVNGKPVGFRRGDYFLQ